MNTFALLADLEVEIDSYTLDGLQSALSPELTRHTTEIAMHGAGLMGLGEDVVYQGEEQIAFQQRGPIHDLSGRRTIAEFCDLIEQLDLFPVAPMYSASRLFRVWAFESAALDLALQQMGRRLSDVTRQDSTPRAIRRLNPSRRTAHRGARDQALGAGHNSAVQARRHQFLDTGDLRTIS